MTAIFLFNFDFQNGNHRERAWKEAFKKLDKDRKAAEKARARPDAPEDEPARPYWWARVYCIEDAPPEAAITVTKCLGLWRANPRVLAVLPDDIETNVERLTEICGMTKGVGMHEFTDNDVEMACKELGYNLQGSQFK